MRRWFWSGAVLAVWAGSAAAQQGWEFYADDAGNRGAAVCPIATASDFLCFEIGCTDDGGLDFVIAAPSGRLPERPLQMALAVDGRAVAQVSLQPRGAMGTQSEYRAPVGAAGQAALRALELGGAADVTLQSDDFRRVLSFDLTGSMQTIAQARADCAGQPVNPRD
ncbi:MAG: hypothetical protein HLUCCA08_16500 [Rhodobacteraceae bacterium HLUCCA08]|nr:MAG: hypothetical protein HLUCCA08_16500 [Rhodobacteraceae bacterium HLUCCA08]